MKTLLFAVLLFAMGLRLPAQTITVEAKWRTNYDESKTPSYTLPDPLMCINGIGVTTADEWERLRRPEIMQLARTYEYGRAPELTHALATSVDAVDTKYLGGRATLKRVTIAMTERGLSGFCINAVVCTPNVGKHKPRRRWPMFLQVSYTLAIDETVVGRLLDNGMGYATFSIYEVCPDTAQRAYTEGLLPQYYRPGQTQPDPDQWGAIGAWAWAASRVMDYMQGDADVDPRHVAIIGQSRLGKTALWAGAQDERFALVVPVNSGCCGTALSKRMYGETVWNINHTFPHWFCGNFKQFNMRESALPIDQHEVIALCAPRPVYICTSELDDWSDQRGQFLAARAAEPVYALYGKRGMGADTMPPLDSPLQSGTIGFHIRTGKHAILSYDWQQAIRFARRVFAQ